MSTTPTLEEILDGPLQLIFKAQADALKRFKKVKQELKDFLENEVRNNPRPKTQTRVTRSQSKNQCSDSDLDDFYVTRLNESMARLDLFAQQHNIPLQLAKKETGRLDKIRKAGEGLVQENVEPEILSSTDSTTFQTLNANPKAGVELGARPKILKPKAKKPVEMVKTGGTTIIKNPTFSMFASSSADRKQLIYPSWSTEGSEFRINSQQYVDESVVSGLFPKQDANVDLKAVFPHLSLKKLERRSSADWNAPSNEN